jgi:putative membrane protein
MIVLETLGRRWYAFGFVAVLLWSASDEDGGLVRAIRFLSIAFVVQLAAELSSTRNGFPFGRYTYVAPSRGDELYISNVPLFVPVAFGTVVWAGRAVASAILTVRGVALAVSGALAAAVIDAAIDPMTLRGSRWFLGPLYAYESGGPLFDVPWSNFAGWILAAGVILLADGAFKTSPASPSARSLALPAGILAFFIALALATRQWAIAASNAAITLLIAAAVWNVRRRRDRAMPARDGPP